MLFKTYKFDIAFSFVEADRAVIERVADEIKKRKNIRCYIYTEHEAANLGEHIIDITRRVYLKKSRFVLMVTSSHFVKGFWSRIERAFLLAYIKNNKARLIQLKLDETPVDGLSEDVVHFKWNDDPQRIAGVLIQRVLWEKKRERRGRIIVTLFVCLLLAISIGWYTVIYLPIIKPGIYPLQKLTPITVESYQDTLFADSLQRGRFYINKTEVTVAEYRKYCAATGRKMPSQPWPVLDNNPVVNVNWSEARAFCEWTEGRLPSEYEWKQAAAAGLQTKYSGGNNAGKVAVYKRKHFRPVATKSSNAFGLFDMSGNVAEWCETASDSSSNFKIVKGGSHKDGVTGLLITERTAEHQNVRSLHIGFRVAWDQKPTK